MLRAAALGPVRILLPMISSVGEIHSVREAHGAGRRGACAAAACKLADPLPPLGVMIEIPGAALAADALASDADFFAIGTNDLIQYTLAIDRGDEQVAHLYNPLHPAVLRLIQFAVEAALRARKPVSLCGEMAGDPRYTALLLGLGIRDLSMAPANVARVKERIRRLDLGLGRAPRPRHHGSARRRPHRRPARRLQRARLSRRAGGIFRLRLGRGGAIIAHALGEGWGYCGWTGSA